MTEQKNWHKKEVQLPKNAQGLTIAIRDFEKKIEIMYYDESSKSEESK